MSLWLHNWWSGQAAVQDICAISIHRHMSMQHLYKCMVTTSVHVLTLKWTCMSAHIQTRCSMNIFNLFICDQTCGSCCHFHCPTCMLRCIWSVYVCDHTLGVHCGRCFSQDVDCGETLKQSFRVIKPVSLTPSLFPICTNLVMKTSLYQSQTSSEVLFWKYTISAVYFSVWYWGRAGVVQAQTFFLDMHSMDNLGQRVSSPSPAGRCDVGHHGH